MLAEDTNERFHYLTRHQRTHRLSTAFDGPTLYGLDSDADGVFGKIGEGGVAIDTVEDMVRLYDGFDLGSPNFSASMTISGPAPMIMAMYIAAAKRRFGPKVVPKLRGTVQADIFKEVQAQNETIFPIEAVAAVSHRHGRVHYRRNAALVSNLDQRLSHRRGRLDTGATGCLHALERLCLRGNVRRARNPGRSIRAAPFVLSRLRTRRGVHRALARVAPHLGDRNARRVRRRSESAAVQIAHTNQRTLVNRRRIQKQSHPNGHGTDSVLHERHEFVPLQQRGRTVHNA